ncbi:MAG: glycosyltransferase family 2 protein, partial [Deltaproteobacteria bacterium]|nr:glycosyltransferase family 2 protein [Deltaproteobacteria bacterium]
MKLIIQIPCYNEETTLPVSLSALPRQVEGVSVVEWLVVDDGSTDRTAEVAKAHGVDHVVSHPKNLGLAKAFMTGLRSCIELGADIIVNTDADNQYRADCIPDLIRPIVDGMAEIVIGARPIDQIKHFSFMKKLLQKLGSWTVRLASKTDIPDAPSGFRAISREAAQKLNVFNSYTYTLETIIQAGQKGISITWVPVSINEDLRPSRLVRSMPSYVRKSILTILRIFVVYKPFRFFMSIGVGFLLVGTLIGLRFLYHYFTGGGSGHIQSLILA